MDTRAEIKQFVGKRIQAKSSFYIETGDLWGILAICSKSGRWFSQGLSQADPAAEVSVEELNKEVDELLSTTDAVDEPLWGSPGEIGAHYEEGSAYDWSAVAQALEADGMRGPEHDPSGAREDGPGWGPPEGQELCDNCVGEGKVKDVSGKEVTCTQCMGSGLVYSNSGEPVEGKLEGKELPSVTCGKCDGTGTLGDGNPFDKPCEKCDGLGIVFPEDKPSKEAEMPDKKDEKPSELPELKEMVKRALGEKTQAQEAIRQLKGAVSEHKDFVMLIGDVGLGGIAAFSQRRKGWYTSGDSTADPWDGPHTDQDVVAEFTELINRASDSDVPDFGDPEDMGISRADFGVFNAAKVGE